MGAFPEEDHLCCPFNLPDGSAGEGFEMREDQTLTVRRGDGCEQNKQTSGDTALRNGRGKTGEYFVGSTLMFLPGL